MQARELLRDPVLAVGVGDKSPAIAGAVAARERGRQLFQAVQFDARGVVAEAGHHVLAQQEHGTGGHGEDRQQDGGKQAMTDRELQGGMERN